MGKFLLQLILKFQFTMSYSNTFKMKNCVSISLFLFRYLIFFCPLNLFYKCVAFLPVKLVLVALKEVVRTRKIAAGVHHAHHAYHHGWLIMVITGYVKGKYLRYPERGLLWVTQQSWEKVPLGYVMLRWSCSINTHRVRGRTHGQFRAAVAWSVEARDQWNPQHVIVSIKVHWSIPGF